MASGRTWLFKAGALQLMAHCTHLFDTVFKLNFSSCHVSTACTKSPLCPVTVKNQCCSVRGLMNAPPINIDFPDTDAGWIPHMGALVPLGICVRRWAPKRVFGNRRVCVCARPPKEEVPVARRALSWAHTRATGKALENNFLWSPALNDPEERDPYKPKLTVCLTHTHTHTHSVLTRLSTWSEPGLGCDTQGKEDEWDPQRKPSVWRAGEREREGGKKWFNPAIL